MINLKLFFKNFIKYLEIVFIPSLIIVLILIPALSMISTFILNLSGISYISYTNIIDIVFGHPVALVGLIALFSIIIISAFLEFTFLLLSVYNIRMNSDMTVSKLLALTFDQIRKVSPGSFGFFILYFMLIVPFSGFGYTTPLLSKAIVPNFIIDYILEGKVTYIVLLLFGYIFIFYLAIRLVLVLPILILKGGSIKSAVSKSWNITKGKVLKIIMRFVIVVILSIVVGILIYLCVYEIQVLFDNKLPELALYSAVVCLLLIQFTSIVITSYITVYFFEILLDILIKSKTIKGNSKYSFKGNKSENKKLNARIILIRIMLFIGIICVLFFNLAYMQGLLTSKPMTISHRGVSQGNGVQNTLGSLNTIEEYKPDYVEMDIQETKDHQFVVMHDNTLRKLADIDVDTSELTLKELEDITIRENGYEEKIPSFNEYLKAAKSKNQKLLIEIKTNKYTSDEVAELFIKRYKDEVLTNNHKIQSLDYSVVHQLKLKCPELEVGYILPFNLIGMPRINVDFFTVEYTTISDRFVNKAHKLGKKVFVWTVNSEEVINNMIFLNVDGIITDNMELLNRVIEDETNSPSYAGRLLNFMFELNS